MNYVIIRDDDTNPLTPVPCLERLYRPFLDRDLAVNLATIPNVNTCAAWADGSEEGFLFAKRGDEPSHLPIGSNPGLLAYLQANPGYKLIHHGFEHNYLEFNSSDHRDMAHRLDEGARCFAHAGLDAPLTFVAPYDQISKASLHELAKRFSVLSTGWFELRKLPFSWWPYSLMKKALHRSHWRCGTLTLLTHPGCLLSYQRPYPTMLESGKKCVESQRLTVLVASIFGAMATSLMAGLTTPEIDASSGAAALALLGGGVLVIRGRRKK